MATLGSKAVGSIVKLKENGVAQEYIVVHQGIPYSSTTHQYDSSCNGTWLLRKDIIEVSVWNTATNHVYRTSYIHNWLNSTMLSKYDATIQANINQATLPISFNLVGNQDTTPVSAKVFLLGFREVGFEDGDSTSGPNDGRKLDYFESRDIANSSGNTKRIGLYNGVATNWWLRSYYSRNDRYAFYITTSGGQYNTAVDIAKYGIRPALIIAQSLFVDDSGIVSVNTAPSVPSSISVPSTITDGDTITVSWGAASDAEGNLSGYKLEKSTNGGSSWSQIYQGSARSKTDTISGITQVMYRVKAYDSEGLESGYRTGSNIGIRFKPTAPSSISVPSEINDGQEVIITWGASTDTNGNLSGYKLEKSTNGGTQWSQIYQGLNLSYTDTVSGVAQVCYRVKAYDSTNLESNYATSQNVAVNRYPAITCSHQNNSNLGTKSDDFTVQYTITDADNNSVAVTENIDGQQHRVYTATLGQQNTFDLTGLTFMKLSNGEHTLQIIANDGKASTTYTLTFTKSVTGASVTMKNPVTKTGTIMTCKVTILGNIPADAILTVEVTNNAKDENPVWENCTTAVKNGVNYIFLNKTAAAGYAFNFRVTVERGASNMGGYISEVSGKFA